MKPKRLKACIGAINDGGDMNAWPQRDSTPPASSGFKRFQSDFASGSHARRRALSGDRMPSVRI